MLFRALLIPLAVLLLGLGMLLGDRLGQVLTISGTVLAGVAAVLVMAGV